MPLMDDFDTFDPRWTEPDHHSPCMKRELESLKERLVNNKAQDDSQKTERHNMFMTGFRHGCISLGIPPKYAGDVDYVRGYMEGVAVCRSTSRGERTRLGLPLVPWEDR